MILGQSRGQRVGFSPPDFLLKRHHPVFSPLSYSAISESGCALRQNKHRQRHGKNIFILIPTSSNVHPIGLVLEYSFNKYDEK
jgi:hypothetical protein